MLRISELIRISGFGFRIWRRCLLALVIALAGCKAWRGTKLWPKPQQLPLNLVELFDNDGISSEKNRKDGNFDCPDHPAHVPGSTYPAEFLPESGAIFTAPPLPDVSFLFPNKADGEKNNFSCAGHKFEPPVNAYAALYILGTAENGKQEGEIGLNFEDGQLNLPLKFSDWCEPAQFGEVEAIAVPFRYSWQERGGRMEKEDITCRLWVQKIPLPEKRRLESFVLPYNARMHVFAITLVAAKPTKSHLALAEETTQKYLEFAKPKAVVKTLVKNRLPALRAQLNQVKDTLPVILQPALCTVEAQYEFANVHAPKGPESSTSQAAQRFRRLQAELEQSIAALREGRDPFALKKGTFLRGYLSEIDGTVQPYSLSIPGDYDGERPLPLIVHMHGHGWYAPFQGHPAPSHPAALIASPHGRGSMDYMFVAEDDALSIIEDVKRLYKVDEDRIYLMGHSMGGTGSWNLGVKFSDRFAAIAPNAGNADHKVWEREWGWGWKSAPPFEAMRHFIADMLDPASYAENLLNVPAFAIHGDRDEIVPVGHARSMAERMAELSFPVTYRELKNVGHGGFPLQVRQEQLDWLFRQRRNPRPASVRLKTAKFRYASSYWVQIHRFQELLQFAEIEAHCASSHIDVRQKNVECFSLDLAKMPFEPSDTLTVSVDGVPTQERPVLDGNKLVFTRRGGAWVRGKLPSGLHKKAGLEGAVEDAFMGPFMLVYGAASESRMERDMTKAEAERFVEDWKRLYNVPCRIKADEDVTDEDVARYNLVLYGSPSANSLTARVMPELPIKVLDNGVQVGREKFTGENVGVKFCYPSPLNPERYVVVCAGTSWQAVFQVNVRFGNWFGWGPFDNRSWFDYGVFDDRTKSPETFLCVGFFNQDWQLDPRYQFRGDAKLRSAALPRKMPTAQKPPADAQEAYLSDLMPVLIDQHKGPVNFDRSHEVNPLRTGSRAFK
ncbi:MAG: hypothetical protein FJ272_02895, partial [Planctomycetes bacterium]|nr:hypothetical protein [Planctomycetota bacterium]